MSEGVNIIVSGVQPTGELHLGNYLGAIRNWQHMGTLNVCYFFLADLHAITTRQDPKELRDGITRMASVLMAMDVDHAGLLFRQSHVRCHTELQWLLNGTARMGWLNRMTQFKSKAKMQEDGTPVGLFTYPILQAADILLYRANLVPVGDDQIQHLELARDIAQKFNNDFGETFTIPSAYKAKSGGRVMSLIDPGRKMSKSDPNPTSRINLMDSPILISQKVRLAVTDSGRFMPATVEEMEKRPAVGNLISLIASIRQIPVEQVLLELEGHGAAKLKVKLTDACVELLEPIQERAEQLFKEPGYVNAKLKSAAEDATQIAEITTERARKAMGLD